MSPRLCRLSLALFHFHSLVYIKLAVFPYHNTHTHTHLMSLINSNKTVDVSNKMFIHMNLSISYGESFERHVTCC